MVWLVLIFVAAVQSLKPVILVPGALASKIEAKLNKSERSHFYCSKTSDWYTLWLKLDSIVAPAVNCWADNFKMEFSDGVFSNTKGVETRVAGFGDTHTLDYVDDWNYISYYKDLVEGIMSQPGAVDGVSVRAAPYDFRYSPPSSQSKLFFDKLKILIEDTYNHSGSKVVLVSHSLGGLTTSTFLHTMSQQWKDQYVHAWVSAAGVFGGAVKEVKVLVSHGVVDLPDFVVNRLVQRDVARTIMGNYFMLPRYPVWGKEEVLVQTPQTNYTLGNLEQLFADMGVTDGVEKWKTVRNASFTGDPGVPTHCFNGKDVPTSASFYYKDQKDFPDVVPEMVSGDGDGTVPARSLQVCHKWKSTVQVTEYSGAEAGEHDKIVGNKEFIKSIIELIS